MNNVLRIILVIVCIAALYYLVVVLARSVNRDEGQQDSSLGRIEIAAGVGWDAATEAGASARRPA